MQTVTTYKNEFTGEVFGTALEALASERVAREVKEMFKPFDSWEEPKGEEGIQHTKKEYNELVTLLVYAIKEFDPRIAAEWDKVGGLKPEHIHVGNIINRYLVEMTPNNFETYRHYFWLAISTCSKCYKKYEQCYYVINCKCGK